MTRRVGRNFGLRPQGPGDRPEGDPARRSAIYWIDLPPVWLIGFALAAAALARWLPLYAFGDGFGDPVWAPAGVAVVALGLGLAGWSAAAFARAKTTLMPGETPTALVESGPYRFSRNPIYLADLLLLLGWGLMLGAVAPLLLIPVFAKTLEARFIRPEERRLAEAFPEAWSTWSARVRRWL